MIVLPVLAAGMAGVGGSLLARRLALYGQRAMGPCNLLPQIAGDLRKLAAGTDTRGFLAEYVQLLRQLGRLAVQQLIMLSINLATASIIYVAVCWPLAAGFSGQASYTFGPWLSDVEWSFVAMATAGSILAPFIIRSSE